MPRQIDFANDLDDNQYKAVTAQERFVRVIAGAGSGKTRTLTYRFAYLVLEHHVSPHNILCVTFTNKATEEMKKRIKDDLLGIDPNTVLTFNSLGNRILKTELSRRFGWSNDYEILGDQTDYFPIVREIMKKHEIREEVSVDEISDYIINNKRKTDYLSYIFNDQPTDFDEQLASAIKGKNAKDIIYYEYLKKQGAEHLLDFTDQVCMPLAMFARFPDMREAWSHRFKHILVDEFQDVSDQNYKLCEALTGEDNSLFVVGDPDQVIYGWRDANPDYLINFHKAHPGTSSIQIMTNYRSTKEIIEGANNVIINNKTSHNTDLEMTPFHPESGIKIKYYHAADPQKEAEYVAEQIKNLLFSGVSGNQIAVLYRAHKCNVDIKQQLRRKGIQYEEYKEAALPSLPIVKDVISLMRFIVSPTDHNLLQLQSCLEYYDSLKIDVDPLILRYKTQETGLTEYEAIRQIVKDSPDEHPKSKEFIQMIESAQSMCRSSSLTNMVDYAIDALGVTDYLNSCIITEEENLIESLRETASKAEKQSDTPLTLSEFLQQVEDEPTPEDNNAVQLMTIHAAKGLEFDYVFVIQMAYDIMPSNINQFKREGYVIDLEEERRIAYVAYTRAMKELCLSDYAYSLLLVDDSQDEKLQIEDNQAKETEKVSSLPSHYILEAGLKEGAIVQLSAPLAEEEIVAADETYKKIEWIVKLRTQAVLGKMPLFLEVEHTLYGHGVITGVISNQGAVKVKFDGLQQELTITDFLNLHFVIPEDRQADALSDELFREMPPQDEDDPLTKRVKEVLKLINETATNEEHKDQVSVLALPCGTGKSSAISLKICQTIAAYKEGSKEGILIISNNTKQLSRYLTPKNEIARQYINEHYNGKKKLITLMDKDNKNKALKTMKYSPVLIITTQRYFRLDYFDPVKKFLTFGKDGSCRRTLIIIDEEPTVYENISISATELNLIDSAIKKGLTDQFDQAEKEFCIAHWSAWKQYLDNVLKEYEQRAIAAGKVRQYSYFSDYNKRHARIEAIDSATGRITSEWCEPWARIENMARFYTDMVANMYSLNFALDIKKKNKNQKQPFDLIRALYAMTRWGAVHEFSSATTGHYTNQLSIRVDNRLYFDNSLDAKIIILDGTAKISPVYNDKKRFYVPDCSDFDRRLDNLTIKIHDVATGKTALSADPKRREYVFGAIRSVVAHEIPANKPWAIFTNEELESSFKDEFTTATIEHFGNLRGKNEFNSIGYIVQAGMFRCPPPYYFLFEVDADPALHAQLGNLSEIGEDTSDIVAERITTGYTKEATNRLLLCDIEQNLFRGTIRDSESTAPYTYYLFLSFREYKDLIRMIQDRYQRLGAKVLTAYKTKTKGDLFYEWYDPLEKGHPYTTQDIRNAIGVPAAAKPQDYFKRDPDILEILLKDSIGKGKYVKSGIGGQAI